MPERAEERRIARDATPPLACIGSARMGKTTKENRVSMKMLRRCMSVSRGRQRVRLITSNAESAVWHLGWVGRSENYVPAWSSRQTMDCPVFLRRALVKVPRFAAGIVFLLSLPMRPWVDLWQLTS